MSPQPYPYYTTTVSVDRTQAEIQHLLYKHGAQGTRWTSIPNEGVYEVEFLFPVDQEDGTNRLLMFRVRPTIIKRPGGEPHPEATMRLVFWWLKTKLESIQYGLRTVTEEFLAEVVHQLPSGKEATIGEILIPTIFSGEAIEPGSLAKRLAPPKDEDD